MEKFFSKFFFLEEVDDLDIFRQYIYTHLIHLNINEALFRSLK